MGARRGGGGRDGAFTVSKAASDSASSRATFSTARDAQSVTLDDVPEFRRERARARRARGERARRIGNLFTRGVILCVATGGGLVAGETSRGEGREKPSDDDAGRKGRTRRKRRKPRSEKTSEGWAR